MYYTVHVAGTEAVSLHTWQGHLMRASESSQRRESALLRWLQSHFETSTTVHVHRILADPNADIRNSLRRHRPNEARLATCALQGRHKTDSDDLTLSCPKKFLRMFLCRPGTPRPPSFPRFRMRSTVPSAALERSSLSATSGVCHAQPTTCAAPVTQPPAILPPGLQYREALRCDAMPGQACNGGQKTHVRMRVEYPRRSPQ